MTYFSLCFLDAVIRNKIRLNSISHQSENCFSLLLSRPWILMRCITNGDFLR